MAIKNDLKLKKIYQIDGLYTYILKWKQNVTNPLELNVFTASVDLKNACFSVPTPPEIPNNT